MTSTPFNWDTWEGFDELPKELDFTIDSEAINKRLKTQRNNPFRVLHGSFLIGRDSSRRAYDAEVKRMGERFIHGMELKDWTLKSKLQLRGPFIAKFGTGLINLGEHKYTFYGVFATIPKPVRIELPPGLVKQEPGHVITDINEALKASA